MRTFLIFLFICLSAKAAVAQQSPGAISVGQSGGTVTVTTVASPYSTNFLNPSAKVRWCYFKPGYGWKSGIPGYMASVGGNLTFTRPTEAQGLVLFVRKEVSWQLVSGTKTHCTAWQ